MHAVELATADRVEDLAAPLGRSFVDDPMIVWPLGADELDLTTAMFRTLIEAYVGRGWLWEASDGDGVAAWLPPGHADAGMDVDRTIRPLLGDRAARHGELWDWIEERFPREPFWYFDYIAVDSERRRSGIGTALIEHG
jgi:GNAT superfamily N-acetyltransferase